MNLSESNEGTQASPEVFDATIVEINDKKQNLSWSEVENSGMIEIISKYNLGKVLTGCYKAGLIGRFLETTPLTPDNFPDVDPYLLSHVFHYLEIHGVFTKDDKGYYLTLLGKQLFSDESMAQLCFYSEAYENITSNIDKFLSKQFKYGKGILRDGKSLGIHCDTLFREYHTTTILRAINHLEAKKVLDLGCGGGQFLIDVCKQAEKLTGIGLDISEPAISYAKQTAESVGLNNRINFVVADAFDLSSWSNECFTADVLCATGVVHEHFRDGEEAVINILNKYGELLANNFKAFILGEPEIRFDKIKSDSDLYLVHIFTAQGFPHHREEWLNLFKKTKLKCEIVYTRPNAGPRFNFFQLKLK